MNEICKSYALAMNEYFGEGSSLSCYNTADYAPMAKCLGLISVNNGYVSMDDVGFKDITELRELHPDIILCNEGQFSECPGNSTGTKLFYVLCIDSDERFENGGVNAEADGEEAMYCVLELYDNWAEVLDWGYSSLEQLVTTWNTEVFQNVGEGKQWKMETRQ